MGQIELPTTQRAYTLRLRGTDPQDNSWRDALWATHEAINKGAKVFGDWLLTLRGGLSHDLAEPSPHSRGKQRTEEETAAIRKNRRILLAISWLSVEDQGGVPKGHVQVATGVDTDSERKDKVLTAFRGILAGRGMTREDMDSWADDCADSLSAKIRDDAAWINRSAAFDSATQKIGASLTREEVWDVLEPFFGSREAYLAPLAAEDDEEDSGSEEKAKDLVQKAGQWLSSRFGTGIGADFGSMATVYGAMNRWAGQPQEFGSGAEALRNLAEALKEFNPKSPNAEGILSLISGPGYKSATRNMINAWGERSGPVSTNDVAKFAETTAKDEAKCRANTGGKGRRPWSDAVLNDVEDACGFTYLQKDGPARHSEFAVMLDHAARRVSIGHSWIKRAEAERRRFEEDSKRLAEVPPAVAAWLDNFVRERSGSSGATAAGGEYRIRRRAIEGWEEVVKRWKRSDCKSSEDRIAAARETQADPEIDKFGDIQLFEALAADDAGCVWGGGKPDPQPLKDYFLGHDAHFKQRRFKVPAYRHPDPLRHPVFGDFGNSRWTIKYAVHEAVKSAGKKRAPSGSDAAWLKDRHGLRMGLWNGSAMDEIGLRWSSKRLANDLALDQPADDRPNRRVTRADRAGSAASGLQPGEVPSVSGLFSLTDWNGRLQAPRDQLNEIAAHVERHGWDERAWKKLHNLKWLVSFSAKLECRGPFMAYAQQFAENAPAKPFVSKKGELAVRHETNQVRSGHAKLVLSRLPDLRVLSVDLGHRYAAACAVWEALSRTAFLQEIAGRSIVAGGTDGQHLFCHTRHTDPKSGKEKTTIYRRIGAGKLPEGSDHPAPWARLDRQFLIKLQGEEKPARAASNKPEHGINEVSLVENLVRDLGLTKDETDETKIRGVDELMRQAMRIATLGLKRHGRMAKIAYALNPECNGIPAMGGSLKPINRGDDDHIKFLTNTLADWHALATDTDWDGSFARDLWNKHIKPLHGGFDPVASDEFPTRQQQRKKDDEFRDTRIKPIAEHLAKGDPTCTAAMHKEWKNLWCKADGLKRAKDDFEHTLIRNANGDAIGSRTAPKKGKEDAGSWHARLRLLTDWIMGRHLSGEQSKRWNRNVGGLSLTRIATMRSLYQLHKAFAMRPTPDKVQGALGFGESNTGIAQSILDAMERMREQRVKQIASRIAASALGLGGHWKEVERRDHKGKPLLDEIGKPRVKRIWIEESDAKYPSCHAIVIEDLRNYRPDELQTRRENKALMVWSAGKVRKYLEEACQLHGLHLRQLQPNYTSQQDSRTGLPGVRGQDVPVDPVTGEVSTYWWKKAYKGAQKKVDDGKTDAEAHLLVGLESHLKKLVSDGKPAPPTVRVPKKGGDLFIAAPPCSCQADIHRPCPLCDGKRTIQADLNAAANIGLRALLDPDFPGKWWYIPCIEDKAASTATPKPDKTKGSACFGLDPAKPEQFGSLTGMKTSDFAAGAARPKAGRKAKNGGSDAKETTNYWCDPAPKPLRNAEDGGFWLATPVYWRWVRKRTIAALWEYNGLDRQGTPDLAPDADS